MMHKQYLTLTLLVAFVCPSVAFAQAPPVGPGHCVANCGSPGGGRSVGGGGGGGGGGGNNFGNAVGLGFGAMQILGAAAAASQASQTATQSQITTIRDSTQHKHHKKKGQPLG
jgi:hypothetical protein